MNRNIHIINDLRKTVGRSLAGLVVLLLVYGSIAQSMELPKPPKKSTDSDSKADSKTEALATGLSTPKSKATTSSPPKESGLKVPSAKEEKTEATVKLNYISTTWDKVLNQLALETDSTLVMYDVPPGKFSRQDFQRHDRTEAIRILNRELEPMGFKIHVKGNFLTVMDHRRARPEYLRMNYPGEGDAKVAAAPKEKGATEATPQFAKYESRVDSITDRVRQANAQRRSADGLVTPVNFIDDALPPPAPLAGPITGQALPRATGPTPKVVDVSRSVRLKDQSCTQVAKKIRAVYRSRSRLVDTGPEGLPAFEVLHPSAVASNPVHPLQNSNSTEKPADVWFRISLDTDRNELWVFGPSNAVENLVSLIRFLDHPGEVGEVTQLIPGEGRITQIGARLRPALTRLVNYQVEAESSPKGKGNPAAQNPPPAFQRDPKTGLPILNREAAGKEPAGKGPLSREPANPAPQGGLPAFLGNLKGDVSVEALDSLDMLILRGNEKDVEAVMQVIRAIEAMAIGSTPEIRLHMLKHVDSQALATLLTDVYDRMGNLKNRSTGIQSPKSVNVVAVGRPNSVLILAPATMIESVTQLIEELDKPVDPRAEVQVFPLKYAVASSVQQMLDDFYQKRTGLETQIFVVADNRTNSIIVQARPVELAEVTSLIRRIDRDDAKSVTRLKVIPLKHAVASELAEFLTTALQSMVNPPQVQGQAGIAQGNNQQQVAKSVVLEFLGREGNAERLLRSGILSDIRVNADPRTNSLLVTAPENTHPLLAELVRVLDQPSATVAEIKVFSLRNADATAAQTLLQQLFGDQNRSGQQNQAGIQLAGAEDASSSLVPLKFSVDTRTNSVLAIGGAESLRIVEAVLLRLDESDVRTRQNVVIKLRNSPAAEIANSINLFMQGKRNLIQLDPGRTSTSEQLDQEVIVTAEPVNNSLLISATPKYFDEIRKLAADLDREPAQVMIQALLVEVELDNVDEFGIELGLQDSILFKRSPITNPLYQTTTAVQNNVTTSSQTLIAQTGSPGFLFNNQELGNNTARTVQTNPSIVGSQGLSNFAVGRTNKDLGYGGMVLSASSESVSLLVRALAQRRNVQILSRPQVLALDNQVATIQVGQRFPIVKGVTFSAQGLANPVIDQDPSGIILTVTPRISPEGNIVMEMAAEKSSFPGQTVTLATGATPGSTINSPIKNVTTAKTIVKVPDGQTIVVGGMIVKDDENEERKVPYLGDIPLLGKLFRYDFRQSKRTELMIFLTPRIISNSQHSELIKQIETDRMHFFVEDAESLHGPLFGVPQGCPPNFVQPLIPQDSNALPPQPSQAPLPQFTIPNSVPESPTTPNSLPQAPQPNAIPPMEGDLNSPATKMPAAAKPQAKSEPRNWFHPKLR